MGILQDEIEEDVGSVPVCGACGSEDISKDARACWNPDTGLWEVETVFDETYCKACVEYTTLAWREKDTLQRTRIRELNDRFRTTGRGNGSIVVTEGVQAKGLPFVRQALDAVRTFNAFTKDNDPWGEHDFGAFEIEGETLFWKIDMYDLSLTMGSPNPANEAVTARVLTIMMAHEY